MSSAIVDKLRQRFGKNPAALATALGLDEADLKDLKTARKPALAADSREISMTTKLPTRLQALLVDRTAKALNPQLAFDAKVNYAPPFEGVTTKNIKQRAPKIIADLAAIVKGKTLAQDAELSGVKSMVEKVTHPEGSEPEQSLDESVSEPQHKAMMAAAEGQSNLGIPKNVGEEFKRADTGKTFHDELPEFLKGKGMGDDDIKHIMDMLPAKVMPGVDTSTEATRQEERRAEAVGDESPEEKEKREKAEREKGAAEDKKMVTHDEMSAAVKDAVKTAVDATAKTIRDTERGVRKALADVKPWTGELSPALSFDSAEQVHRHAAKVLGISNADKLHPDALFPIISAQPKPGAKPARVSEQMAQDSAQVDSFAKRYPDAARIEVDA